MTEPAPEFLPDTMAIPYAEALVECLCSELAVSLGGPTCMCCLRPGGVLPPMDSCGCGCTEGFGQASVQITNVYPSMLTKFPRPGVDDWNGPCRSATTWVADLTMTVYRCVHGMDSDGRPPTCDELDADARVIQADRAAMFRAFACCDWNTINGETARIVPGAWTPVPPTGNCAGGFMTVSVDLGPLCCPVLDS